MALVSFGFNQRASGTGNVDVTVSANAGNVIFAIAFIETAGSDLNATISTASGTTGSWTAPAALNQNDNPNFYAQNGAYAVASASGSVTVRASLATSAWMGLGVVVMDSYSAFEAANYAADSTSPWQTGTLTPSGYPAMMVGFCIDWNGTTTPVAASGWTSIGSGCVIGGSPNLVTAEYRRYTSGTTQASFTAGSTTFPHYVSQFLFRETSGAALSAVGSLAISGAAALTVVGALASAGSLTISGAAAISVIAALSATGIVAISGVADISATVALDSAGSLAISGIADLTTGAGVVNLSAVGSLSITGIADISAIVALVSAGAISITGAADISAIAALTVAGSLSITGAADISAIVALAAVSGLIAITGSAQLTAAMPGRDIALRFVLPEGSRRATHDAERPRLVASDNDRRYTLSGIS